MTLFMLYTSRNCHVAYSCCNLEYLFHVIQTQNWDTEMTFTAV